MMSTKGECFVIAPIGDPESKERNRTDRVFDYIVAKAAKDHYEPRIAHRLALPGTITMQIVDKLATVPLVIADLTDNNANVFYELALRHALNLPVILLIEEKQQEEIPFDVRGLRTIPYDLTDPVKIDAAITELSKEIAEIESSPWSTKTEIAEHVNLVHEPCGPFDQKILLGTLLIANRFRYEVIEPYFETLDSVEIRNTRLRDAFSSVMLESAQKEYLQRKTTLSAFQNPEIRKTVTNLFDDVGTIIPKLTAAMFKEDEEAIKAQLRRWRKNNTEFFQVWLMQYEEWIKNNL
jgi:hypothetical protein